MSESSSNWDEFDYYKLMDDLTIHEAAALIAGASPNEINSGDYNGDVCHYLDDTHKNHIFSVCVSAITRAIERDVIPAIIRTHGRFSYWKPSSQAAWQPIDDIDPSKTTIEREDLRAWLKERGFNHGFFFPDTSNKIKPYLDPDNLHYAKKLAALIAAWEAADKAAQNDSAIDKNPNAFVAKWLIENADSYNLRDKDQTEGFFKELAATCNWNSVGGRNGKTSPHVYDADSDTETRKNKKRAISSQLNKNIPEQEDPDIDERLPF